MFHAAGSWTTGLGQSKEEEDLAFLPSAGRCEPRAKERKGGKGGGRYQESEGGLQREREKKTPKKRVPKGKDSKTERERARKHVASTGDF